MKGYEDAYLDATEAEEEFVDFDEELDNYAMVRGINNKRLRVHAPSVLGFDEYDSNIHGVQKVREETNIADYESKGCINKKPHKVNRGRMTRIRLDKLRRIKI